MRRAVLVLSVLALGLLAAAPMPAVTVAAPRATLSAKFQPDRLGAATAVSVSFHLQPGLGEGLQPLSNFALRLPRGMGVTASQLGLATCSASRLLAAGADGCPPESLMGDGSAQVRVPFSTEVVSETARVFVLMSKPVDEKTTMLFYFDGRSPVIAPIVLQSQVVTPQGSTGSLLETAVPPIPSTPEGPEASLVSLRSTLGPADLRYYHGVDGHRVPYRPEGLSIPERCPAGGFRFEASFRFRDGSRTRALTTVPCPRRPAGPAQSRRRRG